MRVNFFYKTIRHPPVKQIERHLKTRILEYQQVFPAVFVNGPRQAGKRTLVRHLMENDWPADYVTFNEATMLDAAEGNPRSFLRAYERNLVLNEFQMAPSLFRMLKILIDETRFHDRTRADGRYLLTGPTHLIMLPELADAMVGRMGTLTLYPLSALEIAQGRGDFLTRLLEDEFEPETVERKYKISDIMSRATYPEITDKPEAERSQWFEAYITSVLQRDVRQIYDVAKLDVLPNLVAVLAARAGGLIDEIDVARTIGQNQETAENHRILLQMIFLTLDVRSWFRNVGKRLVKAPKGYFIDTSLLCHLQQIDMANAELRDPHVFGKVFENFVVSELLKQLSFSKSRVQIQHFRTSDNKKVDIVLEQPNGKLAGIEIKNKDTVAASDFIGLNELRRLAKGDFICGIVLYRGSKAVRFGDSLWAIPVDFLWA